MTRRARALVLVLAVVAAAIALVEAPVASSLLRLPAKAEVRSSLLATTETPPARVATSERRDESSTDRGTKTHRLVLLAVLAAVGVALATRRSRTGSLGAEVGPRASVRGGHLGRSPPVVVV